MKRVRTDRVIVQPAVVDLGVLARQQPPACRKNDALTRKHEKIGKVDECGGGG